MQSLQKGYAVFDSLIDINAIRARTCKPLYAKYDAALKRYFAGPGRFRPEYNIDHYLLLKNKEDSLVNRSLPQRMPTRQDIVDIVSRKPKKSLLKLAEELTRDLQGKTPAELKRADMYRDILRESISTKVLNLWMNDPDDILPVYREMLGEVEKCANMRFPPRMRLAADKLVQKAEFVQADGYACSLAEFPCHLPWDTLTQELAAPDLADWSAFVVWIFLDPMGLDQGGIHFIPNSHKALCAQGKEKGLHASNITSHSFAPMRGHISLNLKRFGLLDSTADSYTSFGAGTVVVMHPATLYCMPVNMRLGAVSSQQLYLMRDGAGGPRSPDNDASWYGRHVGKGTPAACDDPDLFPLVLERDG